MQDEMRDRLIELIGSQICDDYSPTCDEWEPHSCEKCYANSCTVGKLADYLIANGVILPPCKIGDIVYVKPKSWHIESDGISSYQITNLTITQNKKGIWTKKYRAMYLINGKTIDSQINFEFDDIGKTVFLSREAAEKKLEELKNENS